MSGPPACLVAKEEMKYLRTGISDTLVRSQTLLASCIVHRGECPRVPATHFCFLWSIIITPSCLLFIRYAVR